MKRCAVKQSTAALSRARAEGYKNTQMLSRAGGATELGGKHKLSAILSSAVIMKYRHNGRYLKMSWTKGKCDQYFLLQT